MPKILFNQRNPAFTVYNRVEGLDLVEAGKKLGEDRYLEALRETGKTLARIHQVEGCGYGEPDLENLEQGKYCSWRDFVTDEVREIEENVEAWQFDLVVDRALENLDLDEIPENPYSSAFHNDYSRENVIFNGEEAFAVDLDNLIYGDPRLEFIELDSPMMKASKKEIEAIRKG